MAETQPTLTADERQFLIGLLQTSLKETLVEEHRTRAPSYREHIVRSENLIRGILAKLGAAESNAE